jgi:hypothetical protein
MLWVLILMLSAAAAQTRIRLQGIDHPHEVIEANDPFKLEATAPISGPNEVGLDSADFGKANRDTLAALEIDLAADHKAMGRDIGNVHRDIAEAALLTDNRVIDRVPCGQPQVGNRQLCSRAHTGAPLQGNFEWQQLSRRNAKIR